MIENPTCPYCQAEMIKTSIQDEEGTWSHCYWICECEAEDNNTQLFIHHSLYPYSDGVIN